MKSNYILSDIISDHETQYEWKTKLTMAINSFRSKDSEEIGTIYSPSENAEVIIGTETDKIIEYLADSFLQRYQKGLEDLMRGSEFVFDNVDLLYYKINTVTLNSGESFIVSPEWLINKKVKINPKTNDGRCFQYAMKMTLNNEQIESHPERISHIKPFIDQYNWKKISFQ